MWKSEVNLDTLNHNYVKSFQLVYIWGKQEYADLDSNLKIRWKLHQLLQEEEIKNFITRDWKKIFIYTCRTKYMLKVLLVFRLKRNIEINKEERKSLYILKSKN